MLRAPEPVRTLGHVRRGYWYVLIILGVAALAGWPASAAQAAKYPDSIAAVGDSITTAFGTGASPLANAPENSWSSGSSARIASQYRRILVRNQGISGNHQNLAEIGADMADMREQMSEAAQSGAEYVTVLLGANDACRGSVGSMTSVKTFRNQFTAALRAFFQSAPNSRVFVASIPDVNRLWKIHRDNSQARTVWRLFGICQSLLANPRSNAPSDVARRKLVRKRVIAYNRQLARVCARFPRCKFDGNAVFRFRFRPKHVSAFDFFHPSLAGQRQLAAATWKRTFKFGA